MKKNLCSVKRHSFTPEIHLESMQVFCNITIQSKALLRDAFTAITIQAKNNETKFMLAYINDYYVPAHIYNFPNEVIHSLH